MSKDKGTGNHNHGHRAHGVPHYLREKTPSNGVGDRNENLGSDGVPPTEVEEAELRERVNQLSAELEGSRDQLLRAFAETQNVRKRMQAERDAIQRHSVEQIVRELLPVLDNFERTLAAAEAGATYEGLLEGVKTIDRQLRSVLKARKVERIDAQGAAFDPHLHEAVATHETHELPEGTVVDELEPGYRLVDAVLRPAKVRVAKRR